MNRNMALALLLALSLAPTLSAQGAPPESLAKLYHVTVKPSMEIPFEQALRSHAKWRTEQGDPWTWIVYQVVNGDGLGDYYIRSGNHAWADFDAYDSFLMKGAPHFNAVVGPYLTSLSSVITGLDTVHMLWPEDPSSVKLLQLITYEIKEGHQAEFNQAIAEVHDAIVKTHWPSHYAWEFLVNGSAGPRATLVLPAGSWAGMKAPEKSFDAMIMEAMGEAGAKAWFQKFGDSVVSERSAVVRIRLDLSVVPH